MTYNTQMSVNSSNSLVGARLQQLGCDDLLDRKNNAIFAPDPDRRAAVLNCLHSILDLEVASVGGEDGVGEIVTRSYRRLSYGDMVSLCSRMMEDREGQLVDTVAYHGEILWIGEGICVRLSKIDRGMGC